MKKARLIAIAERIVGFPVGELDYVWGETFNDDGTTAKIGKVHLSCTSEIGTPERYRTFCGIEDRCGNWNFASEIDMGNKDFCKRCKKTAEKALKKAKKGKVNDEYT